MNLERMTVPPELAPWVDRLRPGHWIWLTKEEQFVRVAVPWQPPEPGCVSGKIGVEISPGFVALWFVKRNGQGFDGKQLIEPVVGNLPIDPPPLPQTQIASILYALTLLVEKNAALEKRVKTLEERFLAHQIMTGQT